VKRALFVTALVVSGCVPTSAHDRDSVSNALEARTGRVLRPAGEDTNVRLPPGTQLGDGVDEDEAVGVALWNNARFQADLTGLGLARADLIDAGMIRDPLFTLFFPLGPKQLEFTAWFPIEALWQRPAKIAAAQADVERVATNLVQSGLDFVRDVRLGWADTVLANDRARLARDGVMLRQKLTTLAEARRRNGDISELELSTVRLELHRAEVEARRLEREADAARIRLAGLLGVEEPVQPLASEPEPRSLTETVKDALALRPDLRAAELAIDGARERGGAAVAAMVPPASLIADANGQGTKGFEMGPGFQVELPLWNQQQGPRARAAVELERAWWNYAAVRRRIEVEVADAKARYLGAREALELLRGTVLREVDSNLALASRAFAAGEVSNLVVLEAARLQVDARQREVELLAEVRRASAELDRSVGRKHVESK